MKIKRPELVNQTQPAFQSTENIPMADSRPSQENGVASKLSDQELTRDAIFRGVDYDSEEVLKRNLHSGIEFVSQTQTHTSNHRYTKVFHRASEILKNNPPERILSFGCSSGEEVENLALNFFTNDNQKFTGLDVNQKMLDLARANNPDPMRIDYMSSSNAKLFPDMKFDLVFAMSVLCVWPLSKGLDDLTKVFPFERFEKMLLALDGFLNPGGMLVICNSNYRFLDTKLSGGYSVIDTPENYESGLENSETGFVKLFGVDSMTLGEVRPYNPIFYRKKIYKSNHITL
jgi:SAM-dependent methyltransferase